MSADLINLVPPEVLAQRRAARWRGRWVAALAGAGVVVAGATVALRTGTGNTLEGLRSESVRLSSQLEDLNAAEPGLIARVGMARRTAGAATVLADRPDWSVMLAMLDRIRGPDVALEEVVVGGLDGSGRPASVGGASAVRVRIRGVSGGQGAVQSFLLAVERSAVFDAVVPLGTRAGPGGEGVVFEAECWIGTVRTAGVTP